MSTGRASLVLAVTLFTVLAMGVGRAEVVYTTDGRTLEGTVVRRDGVVTIDSPAGLFQLKEADVSAQPVKPAAPAAGGQPLPQVEIVTNMGAIKVELFEDDAPNTVANFISLAEAKFYAGVLFHRCIEGFMIQGGDPLSKDPRNPRIGSGGPGHCIKCEINKRKHDRGVLSMAHAGKDTGGSQFFVTLVPTAHLDGKHTVFGRVVAGLDVVDKIGSCRKGAQDRPLQDVKIEAVNVLSKRSHPYTVQKLPGR